MVESTAPWAMGLPWRWPSSASRQVPSAPWKPLVPVAYSSLPGCEGGGSAAEGSDAVPAGAGAVLAVPRGRGGGGGGGGGRRASGGGGADGGVVAVERDHQVALG